MLITTLLALALADAPKYTKPGLLAELADVPRRSLQGLAPLATDCRP